MSVKLFSLFVRSLKHNLPRHPVRSGFQYRQITAMEAEAVKPAEEKQEIVPNKGMTRFKKRFNKRQWDEPKPIEKVDGESDPKKPFERIKRKKMAMILGYSGIDYHGMQRNPGVPTIEEELLKALYDAKYITEEDFNNQQGVQFQRSSRTDKGVSAARQIVSLKLPLELSIDEVNKRLPDCIRVFGVKRVTNRFNSKSKCNARTYSYTLPTFIFDPSLESEDARRAYRIPAEKLQLVNDLLGVYKGTRSYHNFTEKKHHQDPSSLRHMMGVGVEKIFVTSDMEFAVILVKGQSFMLHQIRKMVGLVIAVVRGIGDMSIMEKAFGKEKVMIPTAPGLGLVLDKVHYERYDAKFKDSHDSLTWDHVEDAIQSFKRDYIYPPIVKGEIEGNMLTWLEKLHRHNFEPTDDVPEKLESGGGDDDDDDDGDNEKYVGDEAHDNNGTGKGVSENCDEKARGVSEKDNDDAVVFDNEGGKDNDDTGVVLDDDGGKVGDATKGSDQTRDDMSSSGDRNDKSDAKGNPVNDRDVKIDKSSI